MPELLPCPFCGGFPSLNENTQGRYYFYVECESCDFSLDMPTQSEAIQVWNTRTAHTELSSRLAEVEAALGHYADETNWNGPDDFKFAFAPSEKREHGYAIAQAALKQTDTTTDVEK